MATFRVTQKIGNFKKKKEFVRASRPKQGPSDGPGSPIYQSLEISNEELVSHLTVIFRALHARFNREALRLQDTHKYADPRPTGPYA